MAEASATMPLAIIRPRILQKLVLMPCARAMAAFAPVARSEQPSSVPKNQYSTPISTTMTMAVMRIGLRKDSSFT